MAIDKRVVAVLDGSTAAFTDRELLGVQFGISNPAGASAGASVSVVVTFAEPLPSLGFGVWIGHHQDATAFVTNETLDGFTVTLSPRLASEMLAAGTFDVMILG
jgi:hypothetical protein